MRVSRLAHSLAGRPLSRASGGRGRAFGAGGGSLKGERGVALASSALETSLCVVIYLLAYANGAKDAPFAPFGRRTGQSGDTLRQTRLRLLAQRGGFGAGSVTLEGGGHAYLVCRR